MAYLLSEMNDPIYVESLQILTGWLLHYKNELIWYIVCRLETGVEEEEPKPEADAFFFFSLIIGID